MAAEFNSIKIATQPAGSGVSQDATEGNHLVRLSQLQSLLSPLTAASHAAVTKQDSNSVAITLSGQQITAAVRRKTSPGTNEGAIGEDSNGLFVQLGTGANQAARGSDLAGKADAAHTHAISEVTNLQTTLDSKSDEGHTHGTSEIAGLPQALAGKADANHTHAIATTAVAGFMSAADKAKLDSFISGGGGGSLFWLDPVATRDDLPLNIGPVGSARLVQNEGKAYACIGVVGYLADQWQPIGRRSWLIGDGAATQYDRTHNFGTKEIIVSLQRVDTGEFVSADIRTIDDNTVRVIFGSAPASNNYRLTVLC